MNSVIEIMEKFNLTELSIDGLYELIKKPEFEPYRNVEFFAKLIVDARGGNLSTEIQNTIFCIYLNLYLVDSENQIKDIVKNHEINKLDYYLKTKYPLVFLIIEYFPEYELEISDDMINRIIAPFSFISEIDVNVNTEPLFANYLDVFYKIRTCCANKFVRDIFKDIEEIYYISRTQQKLNIYMKIEIPSVNIKPEQLGLLDITKLKN